MSDVETEARRGRPRGDYYEALVKAVVVDGMRPVDAAREFNISRARVSQIIAAEAPDYHAGRKTAKDASRKGLEAATIKAMKAAKGNRHEAAKALGVSYTGLVNRLHRYGLIDRQFS